MESPASFGLKAEPVSPLWELELLDVGENWDGDLGVSDEADVKILWDQDQEQDNASDLIDDGEPLFSIELDQIILEEDIEFIKEGMLGSIYSINGGNCGSYCTQISRSKTPPTTDSVHNHFIPQISRENTICTDPNCVESVCTSASCRIDVCTSVCCNPPTSVSYHQTTSLTDLLFSNLSRLQSKCTESVAYNSSTGIQGATYNHCAEPFARWLDSGAIYDGSTNNSLSVLPNSPTADFTPSSGLWTSPESLTDEKPIVFATGGGHAVPSVDPLASSSVDLLKEFEDVLSQAAGSLTPPDSPRSNNGSNVLLQTLHSEHQPLPSSNQESIMMQDIAYSTGVGEAELDQLMADTIHTSGGPPAIVDKSGRPWDSPSASSSCGASDSGYDDPDWSINKSAESADEFRSPKKSRLTTTEERRMRKKEQNKNAATRYRMKKKMEMEEIIGEEKELQDRNESLKTELLEITREIRYLKRLMGDLFRAKGLIKPKAVK